MNNRLQIFTTLVCTPILLIMFSCKDNTHTSKPITKDIISMYVGTYTQKEDHVNGKGKGIYLMQYDNNNDNINQLSNPSLVATQKNPSFITLSNDGKNLYAVSEISEKNDTTGFIHSYKILSNHQLQLLHKIPTNGFAPCHLSFDHFNKYLISSNYVGGIVNLYIRDLKGVLTLSDSLHLIGYTDHPRQESAHPHSTIVSSDNKTVYIADLGSNKIWIIKTDFKKGKFKKETLISISLQKNAGPRHLEISHDDNYLYVINELDNTINTYNISDSDSITTLQKISTLPTTYIGVNHGADIHIHPSGNYLYASNRGHNSIVAFRINKNSGQLTLIDHYPSLGEIPRNFSINKLGTTLFIANQNSDNITTYSIDQFTGELTNINFSLSINTPVCLAQLN